VGKVVGSVLTEPGRFAAGRVIGSRLTFGLLQPGNVVPDPEHRVAGPSARRFRPDDITFTNLEIPECSSRTPAIVLAAE